LSSAPDEYRVRLTAEGIHTFTANAIGPDGNTIYQDTVEIVVKNRTQLSQTLSSALSLCPVFGELYSRLFSLISKKIIEIKQKYC
jgi:hypothetical protein